MVRFEEADDRVSGMEILINSPEHPLKSNARRETNVGCVVISIDAELGWGFHDMPEPPVDRLEAAQDGWQTLLEVLDTHDVPATWAVVGHLLLEDCDGVHADLPSIDGWFDRERGEWLERRDLRYGTDLVADVADSGVDHDIGCHTFSHVLFDDPRVSEEIATAELEAAISAADSAGIRYDSFVFPRNAVGYRDLLAEFDFSCYRSAASVPPSGFGRAAEKLLMTVDPTRVDLVEPTVDEYGLVDVPPSLFLFGFEGWPRGVAESFGVDPIVRQAKSAIDRASRESGVCHMWLHPNNLRTERDVRRLRSIVRYAAERRDDTDLEIQTMSQVANKVRTNE